MYDANGSYIDDTHDHPNDHPVDPVALPAEMEDLLTEYRTALAACLGQPASQTLKLRGYMDHLHLALQVLIHP